jgi:type IV pilus assembly protein PilY1
MEKQMSSNRIRRLIVALSFALLGSSLGASAALQDLSQSPLASAASNLVKPNISYVLDTSGSMAWSHAPDESQPWTGNVGYKSSQCNSIYYNPNIIYPPARNYDGTQMANSSFTAAPKDGFSSFDGTGSSTVNLSTSFYAYDNTSSFGAGTDTLQPAYYYLYYGSQQATGLNYQNTSSAFYKECAGPANNAPTSTVTFSGSSATAVNSLTVNGTNIMSSGATATTTSSSTQATNVAAKITASGYAATASGSVVTITGPVSAAGVTPVISTTPPIPNATITFSGSQLTGVSSVQVNGLELLASPTATTTNSTTLASLVAAAISQNGYTATSSGAVVTVVGPFSAAGFTPVVTEYGNQSATITFSGSQSTSVTGITVGGTQIMSGATALTTSSTTEATNTAAKITQNGYSATASSNVVTVTGPPAAAGLTPVVTTSGLQTTTINVTGSGPTSVGSITVNGTNIMTGGTAVGANASALASLIAAQIGAGGFTATSSGSAVTVTGPASANGFAPVVSTTGTETSTLTVGSTGTAPTNVTSLKVSGTSIISGTPTGTTCAALATSIAAAITGAYSATASSCNVTIIGPLSAQGIAPVATVAASGTLQTTITVGGSGSTSVGNVKVNGTTITTGATTASSSTSTVASRLASAIAVVGSGYTATVSGSVVTITGPAGAAGFPPVVTVASGNMTFTAVNFPAAMSVSGSAFAPNSVMSVSGAAFANAATMGVSASSFSGLTTMSVSTTAFPPGGTMTAAITPFTPFLKVVVSSTSGPGGTDERQNFANWFTYYRIRIIMMKSGLGRAFVNIGSNYRVGFMTIYTTPSSSTTDPGYLSINDYTATQKQTWFTKVYSQTPGGGTPLKTALSVAARNIAGKVGPDPQQYSCQQNFILLSTDGYWNSGTPNGVKLDGSTAIGNQDNTITTAPRPQYDGALSGSSNTLADVAYYYYNTDLRPGVVGTSACTTGVSGADVCQDNVPVSGLDNAPWQHVTLFTLGLGTNGQLVYDTGYLTGGSADFNAIVGGSKNWPTPVGDTLTTIDDLWHAAVNGHGQYFSAKNPDLLVSGLNTALAGVSARLAAGAAAATSNLEPVAGDNFAFVASYTTQQWTGDLQSRTIDLTSGTLSTAANWSAQALLDATTTDVTDTRTIFTFLNGVKTDFNPASFTATQKANWFTPANSPQLSQYAGWTAAQVAVATPDTVINYLRGQWGFEERGTNIAANQLYRVRAHVLGDIIDGKPVYMRLPPFQYVEHNYPNFVTSVAGRNGTVYVGANDGMLHAFDSASGNEIWAYIPSFVLPNLKNLASDGYTNNHQYFVDGSPIISDVWTGSAWKTILVGGLGGGGKGYFALDVTNPAVPLILWEYSDANLGFSYGNPIIGKTTDGVWNVMFTSGYNNIGDGVGRLYVLNAYTGTLRFTVSTGVGSTTSPSGLGKISGWVDSGLVDNTIQRVYGGDMFGNLWRFDINNIIPPSGVEATQLAFFQIGTCPGATCYQQPITTQPELGLVNNKPVIYVGTGRYLGASDVTDLNQQSLYAIVDQLQATGIGNARTETTCPLVQQSLTVVNVNTRSTSQLPVNLTTQCGWFLDFNPADSSGVKTTPGERVSVDPKLQLGVLAVATNIPENSVCTVGGSSFLYFFDYTTGQFVSTSSGSVAGSRIANAIAVGVNTYQLPSGKVVTTVTTSDDQHPTFGNPSNPNTLPQGRRVLWRELLN